MAIETFWRNLSNARLELDDHEALMGSLRPGASVTLPRLDLWLTPQAVEGFESEDFWFLPLDQQDLLERSVDRFVTLTRPLVHDLGGVSDPDAMIKDAERELRTILDVLELSSHRDARGFRVAKILDYCQEKLKRTLPQISKIMHRIEDDSTGEEALWVWVILEDEATKGDKFYEITRQVRSELTRMLRAYGVELWPFIHFRSRSEQDEVVGERR